MSSTNPPRYGSAIYGVARYTSAAPGRKSMGAKVALNIAGLSVADKVTKGNNTGAAAGSAAGILVLGTPAPVEVANLATSTGALDTARNNKATADNNAKIATQAQLAAEQGFNDAYAAYGRIGQTKSGGDPVKIVAIGLDVAVSHSTPIGAMTAPLNLVATMSDVAGHVDLMCDSGTGVKVYIWQCCSDPMADANWRQVGMGSASSFTVTSLTSGTKYWFRVAAVGTGTGNQSPWSDPALKMAP